MGVCYARKGDALGFPGGSDGKASACNVGDPSVIPGLGGSPGGCHSNPLQYSGLENPHEHRSLVGYSPWGRKELDMTESFLFLFFFLFYGTRSERRIEITGEKVDGRLLC